MIMLYSLPQELKILKSKVDVEAEQNASSFTSTVNTEPCLMATLVCDTYFSGPGEGGKEEDFSESRGAAAGTSSRDRKAGGWHKSSPSYEFCQHGSDASKVPRFLSLFS